MHDTCAWVAWLGANVGVERVGPSAGPYAFGCDRASDCASLNVVSVHP